VCSACDVSAAACLLDVFAARVCFVFVADVATPHGLWQHVTLIAEQQCLHDHCELAVFDCICCSDALRSGLPVCCYSEVLWSKQSQLQCRVSDVHFADSGSSVMHSS
jgi:hypothetical protein